MSTPAGSRPIVAIAAPYREDGGARTHLLGARYAQAVVRAGGLPVGLPGAIAGLSVGEALGPVDALLIPGGYDFDTEAFGLGPVHPEARPVPRPQQDWDVALVRTALDRELPVLGICYGMQLLGLVAGAKLHQHLPDDAPGTVTHFPEVHQGHVEHDVEVRAGTILEGLVECRRLPVVSGHHQALATAAPDWIVSATDDDGLIEAIEQPDLPFALGVQWHPEASPPDTPHDALFDGLVAAARVARGA